MTGPSDVPHSPADLPKWQRQIDPATTECLPIRIDPRLGVDEDTAYLLRQDSQPMFAEITAFMTSNYDGVLSAELVVVGSDDPYILIRAASGEEATDLLATGDEDRPEALSAEIIWQATERGEAVTEGTVALWSGEVLFNDGSGRAGPFYTNQMAAKAWAFSNALGLPEADVFGAQFVCYGCAESKAAVALAGREEAASLDRLWASPLRSRFTVPIPLPGSADPGL